MSSSPAQGLDFGYLLPLLFHLYTIPTLPTWLAPYLVSFVCAPLSASLELIPSISYTVDAVLTKGLLAPRALHTNGVLSQHSPLFPPSP